MSMVRPPGSLDKQAEATGSQSHAPGSEWLRAMPAVRVRGEGGSTLAVGLGLERDDHLRRFGLVRLKAARRGVGPIGQVDHHAHSAVVTVALDRLDDIEAGAVDEISVITEQA